jgi:hypothetical protein
MGLALSLQQKTMSALKVFAVLSAVGALAACGTVNNLIGGGTTSAGMGPATCRAANARDFLGQELDPRVVDNARAYAGAMRTRVVKPGDVVTRGDVDPLRLTVEVNDAGKIRRLRCG